MTKEQAREVQKKFGNKYCQDKVVGTIAGTRGAPVQINGTVLSFNTVPDELSTYGCPSGELALLVRYIPAGIEYGYAKSYCGCACHTSEALKHAAPCCYPKSVEIGVNPDKIPPRKIWVKFPRRFCGLPVYYRRGRMAFAR